MKMEFMSIKEIVAIAVGVIITVALIPVAFDMFYDVPTTGWSPSVVTLWGLIPLMIMLALMLSLITYAVKTKTKFDAKTIVEVAVAAIVICALIPVSFQMFYGFNATAAGWSPAVVTLWNLLPLLVILSIVLGIIAFAVKKS